MKDLFARSWNAHLFCKNDVGLAEVQSGFDPGKPVNLHPVFFIEIFSSILLK